MADLPAILFPLLGGRTMLCNRFVWQCLAALCVLSAIQPVHAEEASQESLADVGPGTADTIRTTASTQPPFAFLTSDIGSFLLEEDQGEATYIWDGLINKYDLQFEGVDSTGNYYVYSEVGYPDYLWAYRRWIGNDGRVPAYHQHGTGTWAYVGRLLVHKLNQGQVYASRDEARATRSGNERREQNASGRRSGQRSR